MKKLVLIGLGVCAFFAVSPVFGQADEIELTRAVVQAERQAIVAANMMMSEAEGQKFWPLYRDYRNEMAKLGDRMVKVITTYAENHENLSEETAAWMTEEYMAVEKAKVDLRASWVPRFREALSPKMVARFLQIENRLDVIIAYDMAEAIPLIR